MNYTQIIQFLTIVHHMSLTKAASELYMTQPALSIALSRLEDKLGIKLFIRDGNQLSLTDAGREMIPYFERLKYDYDATNAKAFALGYAVETTISLGFTGSALFFASTYVEDIFSEYQGTVIHKVFADFRIIEKLILSGQLDFAITYPPMDNPEIENLAIMEDEIMVVMPSEHPLAAKEYLELSDLKAAHMSFFSKQNHFRRMIDKELLKHNVVLNYQEQYDYETLKSLIEANRYNGDFITFSSSSGLSIWFGEGYVAKTVKGVDFMRKTCLHWYKDSNAIAKFPEFPEFISSKYNDLYRAYNYKSML